MASAAEQLAANLNFAAFSKAEELKKRIWFTLGALLVYRLGTYIPLPGINLEALTQAFQQQSSGILGMFNMFSGGAVERMAIFALGIMPYISASIILQLMTAVVPQLEQLKKEGEAGRKVINQYTRYLTVVLAVFQSYGIAVGLEGSAGIVDRSGLVLPLHRRRHADRRHDVPDVARRADHRARHRQRHLAHHLRRHRREHPARAWPARWSSAARARCRTPIILGVGVLAVVVVTAIVFVERAQRRLLIQYPKRQIGNRMFQGDSSHLPLKLNTAGVIPPIFASSLLLLPITVANFSAGSGPGWLTTVTALLGNGQPLHMLFYGAMIVFFAFFYTAVVFNPKDTADQLKKHGGFIPGIRPGQRTAEYIDYVLTRITAIGAIYLVIVCLLPEALITRVGIPFYFGGTSLLIVVNVTMDTVQQVQGHLLAHQYEGLVKKSKLRGRRR